MKAICGALLRARKKFKPLRKTGNNPRFGPFSTLQDVQDATAEALASEGLVLVQVVNHDNEGIWLDSSLIHAESGEAIDSQYPLQPGKKDDPQALGATITYARRYAALAVLGIAPEDDDGESARGQEKPAKKQEKPAPSPERTHEGAEFIVDLPSMLAAVKERLKQAGFSGWPVPLIEKMGVQQFREIKVSQYKDVMKWIDAQGVPSK